jgi:hypothetical protein
MFSHDIEHSSRGGRTFASPLSPSRAISGSGFCPPSPFGLWRFVFFSFLCLLARKHSREVSKGESSPLMSPGERLGRASVFQQPLRLDLRSPLVDTRLPTLLAAVL